MKVVGFDTSTDDTVVAATDGSDVLFEKAVPPGRRPVHSQALLELVTEASSALGGWGEVERIAVGIGPGTFTGIRIGVATAAGLAASAGIDAVGVPTLDALGSSIAGQTGAERVLALIDARRGEAFGEFWPGRQMGASEPFVCGPEELVERIRAETADEPASIVAGPGAVRFRDELLLAGFDTEPAESKVHRLAGRSLCELGANAEAVGPKTLEPLYLRVPDAQLWLERDGKSGP